MRTKVDQFFLGINSAHDAAACLIKNGQIVLAIKEERLSRIKNHAGIPHRAIKCCLEHAGIPNVRSLTGVVINQVPGTNLHHKQGGYCVCRQCCPNQIINPSHHLLHAYYAWLASNFEQTIVLIADGSGYNYGEYKRRNSPHINPPPPFSEMAEAESFYLIRKGQIRVLEKRWGLWEENTPNCYRFPSLGHMFSLASQYMFGAWTHAGKTMALAPYGNPNSLPFKIIQKDQNGLTIDTSWILMFKNPLLNKPHNLVKEYCDLAAKVQFELEEALLSFCSILHRDTGCPNICISGGVALNSVANGRIVRESQFDKVFITPAADDGGTAIGAALYGHHYFSGKLPALNHINDFHGKTYSNSEILSLLQKNNRILFEYARDQVPKAAKDIAHGKIVAWFEGSSEFGPRALGHRSILCDPRKAEMKDTLNSKVKFRESFRPYAASVLAEYATEYFDLKSTSPFMLIVAPIRKSKKNQIPAVCHVDDSCRIQTVDTQYEGQFRSLIEYFYQMTRVPILLNTSFNIRGEPIVESPKDALTCFLSTGIDVLYLEKYRVTRKRLKKILNQEKLSTQIPFVNEDISLETKTCSTDGGWGGERFKARIRTGFHLDLSKMEYLILSYMDGKNSLKDIIKKLQVTSEVEKDSDLFEILQRLEDKGLISFRLCQ